MPTHERLTDWDLTAAVFAAPDNNKAGSLLIPLLRDAADLSTLSDPTSWGAIKSGAERHGVAQIVAFRARKHLPASERIWCDEVLVNSWRRHDRALVALDSLCAVFEAAGIPIIALKGPLLARKHYSPPFLRRPSIDLDIGVKESDLERAVCLLTESGFKPQSAIREAKVRSHSVNLSRPGIGIDLHFRLSHGPYGIPMDQFFGRAVPEELAGGRHVLVLDPADELLQLVLHGGCGMATLFHLFEIKHVWNSASLTIRREAVRRAIDYHFAGVFAAAHVLYRSLWGLPLLTEDLPDAQTWLHWRITDNLLADYLLAHDKLAARAGDPTFGFLIWKRWLDLQISDSPIDAVRIVAILARSAVANGLNRVRGCARWFRSGPLGQTGS